MKKPPSVSVVVPVRDRRLLLRSLLESLAKQSYRDFEVVVVDDGSQDGSGDEARAFSDLDVRVVRCSGVGAVAARRAGVAESRGAVLAFTDSDCEADADWLADGAAAIERGSDLAQGLTVPIRPLGPLERSVAVENEDGLFATCNILYRREAYDAAGGFDLDAGTLLGFRSGALARGLGFGEDTLLGWRVRRAGRAEFVPGAVVRHQVVRPRIAELIRRAWIAGAFPSLVREVPELRETLLRGRVFLGLRRLPLYATLIALGTNRRRAASAGVLWWMALRAKDASRLDGPRKRIAAAVPVELAIDCVTTAALAIGSARARTVVL